MTYLKYVKQRDKACKTLRKAKINFEKKLARESKSNPKAFYKYCNFKSKRNSNLIRLYRKENDNALATDDTENANILNDYFGSVFTNELDAPALILNAATPWLYGSESSTQPLNYTGRQSKECLDDIELDEDMVYEVTFDLFSSC